MERTSWPFSVLKPAGTHLIIFLFLYSIVEAEYVQPLRVISLCATAEGKLSNLGLHQGRKLTCSDHNSLHQFTSVEAGLDNVCATEQGVSLVLLYVVAAGCILA